MRYLTESAKICKLSSESLMEILHRFRAQHTLVNSPIIFVYGAIIATNAVLVALRHQHRNTNEPTTQIKDTALPALDTYLQELSAPWALAGEARIKFQRALRTWCPPNPPGPGQLFSGEQWVHTRAQPGTEPDMRFMELQPVDPTIQPPMGQGGYQGQPQGWYQDPYHEPVPPQPQQQGDGGGTGSSPDVNFESPVSFVWSTLRE